MWIWRQVRDGLAAGQSPSAADIAGVLAAVAPQVPTLCAAASQGTCCVGSFVEFYQKVSAHVHVDALGMWEGRDGHAMAAGGGGAAISPGGHDSPHTVGVSV